VCSHARRRAYPSHTWPTALTDTNHTSALPPAAHVADKRMDEVFQCKYEAVVDIEFNTMPTMAINHTLLIEACSSEVFDRVERLNHRSECA
jgi:hypothetical protein